MREADTLVVWKLDRLGGSVKGLVDWVNGLEAQEVHFQSLTDGIDTEKVARSLGVSVPTLYRWVAASGRR